MDKYKKYYPELSDSEYILSVLRDEKIKFNNIFKR